MVKGASKRYLIEFGGAMVLYALVLAVSVVLLNNVGSESGWRMPLALVPMVPLAFVLVAFVRYLGRVDELQRRVQFEALAFAFGGTALITFGLGFMQLVGFPQISWFFVWPIMAVLWLVGSLVANRKYS